MNGPNGSRSEENHKNLKLSCPALFFRLYPHSRHSHSSTRSCVWFCRILRMPFPKIFEKSSSTSKKVQKRAKEQAPPRLQRLRGGLFVTSDMILFGA